jgi:hypothetical protein
MASCAYRFNKNLPSGPKVDGGGGGTDRQTHRQHSILISLHFSGRKESRLKMEKPRGT